MMTRHERRAARARQQAIERAENILKRNPGFPAAQVRIINDTNQLVDSLTEEEKRWATPARLEVVLRQLDIRATAYLELVGNMESQEAFMTLANALGRQAWQDYLGCPPEILQPMPGDQQFHVIQQRIGHWIGEGYKRLIPAPSISSSAQNTPSFNAGESNEETLREPSSKFYVRPGHPSDDTGGAYGKPTPIDIAVITVREDEYDAVLSRLPEQNVIRLKHRTYVIGTVSSKMSRRFC